MPTPEQILEHFKNPPDRPVIMSERGIADIYQAMGLSRAEAERRAAAHPQWGGRAVVEAVVIPPDLPCSEFAEIPPDRREPLLEHARPAVRRFTHTNAIGDNPQPRADGMPVVDGSRIPRGTR